MTKKELHAIQIRNMAKARAALKRKRRKNNSTLFLNPTPPPQDSPLVARAKEFEENARLLWKAQELLRSPIVISGVSMSTWTAPGFWGNK